MNPRQLLWLGPASLTLAVAACSTVRYSSDYDQQARFADLKTYDWIVPSQGEQAAMERVSPFLERRLQRAVDGELTKRGFAQSSDDDPDFWVSAYAVVPGGRDEASGQRSTRRRPRVNVAVGLALGVGHPYGFGYPYTFSGYRYPYFGYPHFWASGYPFFLLGYPYFGYPPYTWHPGFGAGYWSGGGYGYRAAPHEGPVPGTLIVDVIDAETSVLVWRGWAEGALLEAPSADELAEYVDEVVAKIMKRFPPSTGSR